MNLLGGIFSFSVISGIDGIVSDINLNNFTNLQLITSQLMNLFEWRSIKKKKPLTVSVDIQLRLL